MPCVPDQGGIMPVLYDPSTPTSFAGLSPTSDAQYTLNVITTQWIAKGVMFRFQVYNGFAGTYDYLVSQHAVTQFDLVVVTPIPPATVVVVAQTPTATALWDYTGTVQYSNTGQGIQAGVFQTGNTTLAWAYVPTTTGGWAPAGGQPQFAIGFNLYNDSPASACTSFPGAGAATAPNFPNEFSSALNPWVFDYTVVYPITIPAVHDPFTCITVNAIKYRDDSPTYAMGSWSQLRGQITQPWTVVQPQYISTSNWSPWRTDGSDVTVSSADCGPFVFAAMPGQLAVVYFRPLPKDIDTATTPLAGYAAAEAAFLVTAPLPPHASIYFTIDEWDALNGGFGPHTSSVGSAVFVNNTPSFTWITGACSIPAGTVVLFTGIGTSVVAVSDAHNSAADVGVVAYNYTDGQAVVSLLVCGSWVDGGIGSARPAQAARFVTAALSEQYAGDWPDSLSLGLTINLFLFKGPSIYLQGKVIDALGLPGSAIAATINASPLKLLPNNTPVDPTTLPAFLNMGGYRV